MCTFITLCYTAWPPISLQTHTLPPPSLIFPAAYGFVLISKTAQQANYNYNSTNNARLDAPFSSAGEMNLSAVGDMEMDLVSPPRSPRSPSMVGHPRSPTMAGRPRSPHLRIPDTPSPVRRRDADIAVECTSCLFTSSSNLIGVCS